MSKIVKPTVYIVGVTGIDLEGLKKYLTDTDNELFLEVVEEAKSKDNLSDAEILVSFYAKMCYNSLTYDPNDPKNLNLTGVRDIKENLIGCFDLGHLSVFEHSVINFVVHQGSRVYETEQVRHRVGVAYSILSGRYERKDELIVVLDPILERSGILFDFEREQILQVLEQYMLKMNDRIDGVKRTKDEKKKLTSAVRRLLPQGLAREIGISLNLRAIRHLIMMRTSRHSEWEIRLIYEQIYLLLRDRFPLLFYGAQEEIIDGMIEITGMKMQPYEFQNLDKNL